MIDENDNVSQPNNNSRTRHRSHRLVALRYSTIQCSSECTVYTKKLTAGVASFVHCVEP